VVIRDHESTSLSLSQMIQTDRRHLGPGQKLAGHDTTMACDYFGAAIDQDPDVEAKRLDAACDLADLLRTV